MNKLIEQEQSLFDALVEIYTDSSKSTLRSLLKEERVKVDGKTCKVGNTQLSKGQTLEVIKKKIIIDEGVEILYQDPHLAVVVKPAGLLSVSTDYEKELTLHKLLKGHLYPKKVEVVHRLDQDTSGVMLFALDPKTFDLLKETFEQHAIERQYSAIVEGKLTPKKGTWSSYLYEDSQYVVHSTSNPYKGKRAVTHYEVVGYSKNFTRLNVSLETGKKNQIRVHCQDAGHPVAGDVKYGATSNPGKRMLLHAHHLGFTHPIKKRKMQFTAPPPEAFNRIIPQ